MDSTHSWSRGWCERCGYSTYSEMANRACTASADATTAKSSARAADDYAYIARKLAEIRVEEEDGAAKLADDGGDANEPDSHLINDYMFGGWMGV